MWRLKKPTDDQVEAFIAAQDALSYSYREVGASEDGAPAGYDLDHNRSLLGQGPAAFEAACEAIHRWRMFPPPWTEVQPPDTPIETGRVVAMLARAFGLWWMNACRIVYIVDETTPVRRFGFAYGTLPAHVERGEERFTIEWDDEDRVWYDVRAFSRPRYWLVRLGYPLARRLQRCFVVQSQTAMRRFVVDASRRVAAGESS